MAFLVHLELGSDKNWEGNAPVRDSDFPQPGRLEQMFARVFQLCCECLLVGNQLLRWDLIGAIEQVGHRFVDLKRHVLCTDFSMK